MAKRRERPPVAGALSPEDAIREARCEAHRERIEQSVSELRSLAVAYLKQRLGEQKEANRRALVSLLDHLDALAETERLAALIEMNRELGDVLQVYWHYAKAKLPGGVQRSPRADAYAAGKADGVFRDSLFGSP